MTIDAQTKIAALLKYHPDALEAIIQLNPKFVKLRNPLLRKLMAGRTTIAMAAKIGGCTVQDFYRQLSPLGFVPQALKEEKEERLQEEPPFIKTLSAATTTELDVRPILAAGTDPLKIILQHTNTLPPQHTLKILNTFEPTPLIKLLQSKGFSAYTQTDNEDVVATFFYKHEHATTEPLTAHAANDWDAAYKRHEGHLQTLDVRPLPMPLPMHTILEKVENLHPGEALFVYHKRVPLFLLPELAQKGFEVRFKEIAEGEVHLLIFKA